MPVLLGHGEFDRRVTIEHARRFVQAARDATVPIQYVEYPDAAHGFALPATQADWLRRVEQFLEKSLSAR